MIVLYYLKSLVLLLSFSLEDKTLLKALVNEVSEHSNRKDILKSFTFQVRKLKGDRLALKLFSTYVAYGQLLRAPTKDQYIVWFWIILTHFISSKLLKITIQRAVWSWKMKVSDINIDPLFLEFYLFLPSPVKGWAWDKGMLISSTPISSSTHIHLPCTVNNWPNWSRKIRLEDWKCHATKWQFAFVPATIRSKIQVSTFSNVNYWKKPRYTK